MVLAWLLGCALLGSAGAIGGAALLLAGCGKTLWARRDFIAQYVWNKMGTPRRMLKKAVLVVRER